MIFQKRCEEYFTKLATAEEKVNIVSAFQDSDYDKYKQATESIIARQPESELEKVRHFHQVLNLLLVQFLNVL